MYSSLKSAGICKLENLLNIKNQAKNHCIYCWYIINNINIYKIQISRICITFFPEEKLQKEEQRSPVDGRIFAKQHKLHPDKYTLEMSKHQAWFHYQ